MIQEHTQDEGDEVLEVRPSTGWKVVMSHFGCPVQSHIAIGLRGSLRGSATRRTPKCDITTFHPLRVPFPGHAHAGEDSLQFLLEECETNLHAMTSDHADFILAYHVLRSSKDSGTGPHLADHQHPP